MRSPLSGIRAVGIVCVALAISLPVFSQTTMGRILGRVSDQSGAAVAGATVVITDVQRGTTRTVATDASGDYAAPICSLEFIRSTRKPKASKSWSA